MKVVDLHPEDLLDKDARGELTDAERERLEAHLERCATCRFERTLRADFVEDLGDAPQELAPSEIVEIALGHAPRPAANDEVEERAPVSPRAHSRRKSFRIPLLVAAAVLVGGVAGAGAAIPTWTRLVTRGEDPEATTRSREAAPPPPIAPKHATPALPPEPPVETPEAVPEPPPPPPPVVVPARTLVAPPPILETPPDTPATLFESAAEARRRGDHARALEIHRQLVAKFPASREARVSHATIGQLLLDRGDASGALASFDAYRAGGRGPLDEPVMIGRATALDRLGRSDDARAAWSALVESFPRSPYAAHARARIDAR